MQFTGIRKVLIAGAITLIALAAPAFSQTAADTSSKDTTKRDDVSLLKQQIAEQQKEIEQLRTIVDQMKQKLDQPSNPAPTAATPAPNPGPGVSAATTPTPTAATLPPNLGQVASTSPIIPKATEKSSAGGDGNLVTSTLMPSAAAHPPTQEMPPKEGEQISPLQFHIGSATLTPVGFMDFTGVFHSHVAGGNIGTSFGSIPYATSTSGILPYQTNLSEFRLSIQNSRIGFRTDADVKGAHVIGYMEADFLGTPASTNIAVTSNSQLLRARLYWVDLRRGGWEILGGQTWSLITPGRVGISPLPADVFYTQDMDVNYQLGLFWGRIPELRFVYHLPSDKAAFAVAIDSPDQYAGGSSGGSSIVLPSSFPSAITSAYNGELDFSASSGGIATPNLAPDVIAKLAVDPIKRVHFEIGGVERNFKVYYPGVAAVAAVAATATTPAVPAVPAIPAATFTNQGVGGFLNLHAEILKGLRLMTNNFWSDGGGRYIFGQAPDLVVNPDGSITPLHSSSTVSGFEYTNKNTLVFAYYGGLMIGRDPVLDTNGKHVGYGYTGSSSSQNRTIQEATFGFNQAIWKHPKYGAVNIIGQYSYLTRDPWYVATGQPNNASLNMVFIDLRYTLPGSAPTLGRPAR
jgi:hypothetical protein